MTKHTEKIHEVYTLTGYPFKLEDKQIKKSLDCLNKLYGELPYASGFSVGKEVSFLDSYITLGKGDAYTLIEIGYDELNSRKSLRSSIVAKRCSIAAVVCSVIAIIFAISDYIGDKSWQKEQVNAIKEISCLLETTERCPNNAKTN